MLTEAPVLPQEEGRQRRGSALRANTSASLDVAVSDRCFADLATAPALLVAVSGGPDSIALMHLAAGWAARQGAAPVLLAATVDHGLRPEARAEAEMVAAAAERLGLPHAILTWTGPKPSTRLQERARDARYALLDGHARAVGATHVLTGHHADDQAETVLLRLGRGSGLAGLAGMRRLSPLGHGVILARPLLDLSKADLVAVCRAAGVTFLEDPTNHDPVFARARLRASAPALSALGLDRAGLLRLSRRLARADDALEAETLRIERRLAPTKALCSYRIDLAPAGDLSSEIAVRLLHRAVAHVSERPHIRLDRLETLAEALRAARAAGRAHRATLAGTLVVLDGAGVLDVVAEAPRRRGIAPASRP